mmetsp:Transcript_32770/g.85041  ORF Transcript_32770/g.85041 Transcript_32770/m.85041 type:complete len:213 (-) Transcript_32770:212-850(-)
MNALLRDQVSQSGLLAANWRSPCRTSPTTRFLWEESRSCSARSSKVQPNMGWLMTARQKLPSYNLSWGSSWWVAITRLVHDACATRCVSFGEQCDLAAPVTVSPVPSTQVSGLKYRSLALRWSRRTNSDFDTDVMRAAACTAEHPLESVDRGEALARRSSRHILGAAGSTELAARHSSVPFGGALSRASTSPPSLRYWASFATFPSCTAATA